MSDGADEKRGPGRPPKPEDERTVNFSIRLTPARKAKLQALGMAWLCKMIDRAKLPETKE